MENHDIDKMFNEAGKSEEEKTTFPNFEKVWQNVESKLDKKEEKKRIIPIWLPYGIAAGLALTFGVLYFMNDDKAKIEPQIADRVQGKPAQSQQNDSLKIQNLDREIQENIATNPIENPREIIAYHQAEAPPMSVIAPPMISPNASVVADAIAPPVRYEVSKGTGDNNKFYYSNDEKQETSVSTKDIENVVVTGMGIKKKNINAVNVSTVSAAELSRVPNSNIDNALSGKVAGVKVSKKSETHQSDEKFFKYTVPPPPPTGKGKSTTQESINQVFDGKDIASNVGIPGSSPNIIIRGLASINSSNQALYVIDGVPYQNINLQNINQTKIENVSVLKDAAATSIYGEKGKNGVIIIKTKGLTPQEINSLKIQNPINNQESYDAFEENQFENIQNQPLSTFSIDVDKAAYSNIRRMINNGQKVDKNAVRIEEMINYFNYQYPQPKSNRPFSINTEYSDAPWNPNHKLLKIGLQGMNLLENNLPTSNLVFLIDVSGSMSDENKLPLLKESFKVLLEKLRPQDKVALVVYAGSAGTVMEPTSASEKNKIIKALENLNAGGSTAGGEGIELAYKLAQENFIKNGNNRVILATDGDFNVGTSSQADLQTLIEEKRQTGIFLTCLGFGMGNYKDNTLETLANKGNGNYAYIDNMQEANKFLGKEFAGSMYAIAKDVKIQIEFNPKLVKSYRLIGYENRKLRNEDFKNDKIDAGELGSGHTVTALYEVIPQDIESDFAPETSDLKYSQITEFGVVKNELATIKFRYKKPDGDKSIEMVQTVNESDTKIENASPDFKFATSVAWFGLVLRDSKLIKDKNLTKIENLAKQGKSNDEDGYRSEFVRLIESYKGISK